MSDRSKLLEESEEPDSLEARLREMIASGELKEPAGQAIAAQLAQGFPVTFQRGDAVIRLFPDGHEEVIARVPIASYTLPPNVAVVKNR
jgi:hypothetical protein